MRRFVVDEVKNYTVMPNYHLRDKRLSYKARGLLSVILNLPEDWDLTQSGLVSLSDKDGTDSVRSAMKELMDYGYIVRERVKNEKGQFIDTVYHVKFYPDDSCGNDVETVENSPESAYPKSENPISVSPKSDNPTQLNNIYNKNIYKIKDRMNDITCARGVESVETVESVENSPLSMRMSYCNIIKQNIDYDALVIDFREFHDELDELLELMLDVLISDPASTQYIAGQRIKTNVVQSRLLQLRSEHIQQVLMNLDKNTKPIKNIHSYLLTCLYQSFVTTSNQIRQMVNEKEFGKN